MWTPLPKLGALLSIQRSARPSQVNREEEFRGDQVLFCRSFCGACPLPHPAFPASHESLTLAFCWATTRKKIVLEMTKGSALVYRSFQQRHLKKITGAQTRRRPQALLQLLRKSPRWSGSASVEQWSAKGSVKSLAHSLPATLVAVSSAALLH